MGITETKDGQLRYLQVRVRDKHSRLLRKLAAEVDLVWNYCNDLALKVLRRENRFLSAYDLQKYMNGASKCGLAVGSAIFQQVAEVYVQNRNSCQRPKLSWRLSNPKRADASRGWIPFKSRAVRFVDDAVRFQGHRLDVWDSYGLDQYTLTSGCFSEDTRGRWYLNVCVKIEAGSLAPCKPSRRSTIVVDARAAASLALSDGRTIERRSFTSDCVRKLAIARMANKRQRILALRAKMSNRRKDACQKLSTELVKRHDEIQLLSGNATTAATQLPRSIANATWASLGRMFSQKCKRHGKVLSALDQELSAAQEQRPEAAVIPSDVTRPLRADVLDVCAAF